MLEMTSWRCVLVVSPEEFADVDQGPYPARAVVVAENALLEYLPVDEEALDRDVVTQCEF